MSHFTVINGTNNPHAKKELEVIIDTFEVKEDSKEGRAAARKEAWDLVNKLEKEPNAIYDVQYTK